MCSIRLPLYALELPAQLALHLKQPRLVLGLGLLEDNAIFLSSALLPDLAHRNPLPAPDLEELLLLVNFLVAQVAFQLGYSSSSEIDFIAALKAMILKLLVVFLGTRTTYSVTS